MAPDDLCWMPASEMAAAIRRKKVSPVEVMKAVLARIERLNPTLNAFVTLTAEQAMRAARSAERALTKRGATLGPLHGVPFSTKDLVVTKGIRTTFGTRLYADNVPTETAPMVERMVAAGAIQRRLEPVAHRADDPNGHGRRADDERVRGTRLARPVLAAGVARGLRQDH